MTDAVVVGAGLSGLVCARAIARAGRDVVVLEASDRVGGRTLSRKLGERTIDAGAQWMSAGQNRLLALARELGVATLPQYRAGRAVIARPDGPRHLLRGIERWRRLRELAKLARDPSGVDPTMTLAEWLDARVRSLDNRAMLELLAELETAESPARLSMLSYLTTLRASGGLGSDRTEHRFVGGAQQLSQRIADELGDRVRTGCPVRAIDQDDQGVSVTADGVTVRAGRCVLALPPGLCANITVAGRSPAREAVETGMPIANVVKVFVSYKTAFWREGGLSGEAYFPGGTVRATVDLCEGEHAALLAFVVGNEAASWGARPADERRAAAIADLVTLFGAGAGRPIDYLEHDWAADPWAGGCVGNLAPSVSDDGLREPCGRVHYAGSETARAFPRYLEGAIEAGERAADEIIRAG